MLLLVCARTIQEILLSGDKSHDKGGRLEVIGAKGKEKEVD